MIDLSISEEQARQIGSPVGLAELLGVGLYDWQRDVLTWYEDPRDRAKGSVVAPNGSGKDDRVIALLATWWLCAYPRGRVVITSRDSRQIDEQTYPALRRVAQAQMPGWRWVDRRVESPTGGVITLFTTDDAARAEGWHKDGDFEGPLLIIVNEAKSVPDEIFQAFDRCTYNGILYISSAGLMEGRFYDSHTKLAAQYRRKVVRLEDCPHIPRERVEDILATYGKDHSFTRSTLYSEFMQQDGLTACIVSHASLVAALRTPPVYRMGNRSAFCDFAAGGDENVIALREGNRVSLLATWRDRDTMAAVGRFILEFRKAGLVAGDIFGDADGLGKPVIDRLWELGWEINRVHNGSRPYDSRYRHRGAEMWHETGAAINRGEIIVPDDPDLVSQLTGRRVKIESDGRLGVETKADMAKRGLPSPDRADAVVGCWCNRNAEVSRSSVWEEWNSLQEDIEYGGLAGMHTG